LCDSPLSGANPSRFRESSKLRAASISRDRCAEAWLGVIAWLAPVIRMQLRRRQADPLANEFRNEQALEFPFSRQPALVCDFKSGRQAPLWLSVRGEATQPLFEREKTVTFPGPKATFLMALCDEVNEFCAGVFSMP
jgi:hypothetical protein